MNPRISMALQAIGWVWIFVFVTIGVLGAGLHIIDHFTNIADQPAVAAVLKKYIYGDEFYLHWVNFRSHPGSRMIHMVLGILFVLIGPLQFMPKIRSAYPRLHRAIGRTALASSFILIATGWIFAFQFTYTGFPEQVPTVTYSLIYFWLVAMALRSILRGDVVHHREWMIRAFSMMMGISATRVWFYVFLKTTALPSTVFFSTIFWLGLGVNLFIAEIWVNLTRARSERVRNIETTSNEQQPTDASYAIREPHAAVGR